MENYTTWMRNLLVSNYYLFNEMHLGYKNEGKSEWLVFVVVFWKWKIALNYLWKIAKYWTSAKIVIRSKPWKESYLE